MPMLIFTKAEASHIAYTMNERVLRTVEGVSVGVPALRLTFAAVSMGETDPVMLELNRDELRTLDTLLTDADPRAGTLPDGEPLLPLVKKVWTALLAGKDDRYAGQDHHILADADHGEAIFRP